MKATSQKFAAVTSTTTQSVTVPWGAEHYMGSTVITGTASVQFSGSTDNTNFTAIGSAITSTDRVVPLNSSNEVYKYLRIVSTITSGSATNEIYYS